MVATPRRAAPTSAGRRTTKGGRAGPSPKITSPTRPTTKAKTFTSEPVDISFAGPTHRLDRADLEIDGIFHGEASYQGRIFLDNPTANADTPKTLADGYAGSFNIFGHGGCVGDDAGHCDVVKRDPADSRYPHPLTPASKRIKVTETLKAVAAKKATTTVTIVPIVTASTELCDNVNVFRCERMRLVSYNA